MSSDDASSVATPSSPTYVPDPMKLEHHVRVYVPKLAYPEYLAPSDDEISIEDQPLPDDASPIDLSSGNIADSDPKEDPNEDPKEDPADYPVDEGDDDDDESFDDDDKEQEAPEEDDEEEENLALADSSAVLSIDPVPSAEDIEAFETDHYAATPPPPPAYRTTSRISVRTQTPIPFPAKAKIPPPPTSPTYAQAPLGTRAAMMRATSPPTHHPLPLRAPPAPLPLPSTARRANISKADMPPHQKRVDYSFVDTVEASVRVTEPKAMVAIEMVNLRVSYQANVHRRESEEFYTWHQDAQDDRAAVRAEIEVLRREKLAYESEREREIERERAMSEAHNRALEARIATMKTQMYRMEWQRWDVDDRATRHVMRTQVLEAGACIDTLEDTSSSAYFYFLTCTYYSNILLRRMFPEESDEMEKYVGGLPDMILGSVMVLKPKIMQDAIEFATELMDQKIHTLVERLVEKKPAGNCNAVARAYAMGTVGTNPNSNVVTSTFLLNNRYASILFDTGADRSFVSIAFGSLIDIIPTTLDYGVDVELADGRIIWVNTLIRGCTLNFLNHPFNIDLMPVEMGSFDVIIGMDCDCANMGTIRLR
ncbi:putative reverse transcriptase domain-containing protein [Tanacetum coccineum]